jgi:hypothetical protein
MRRGYRSIATLVLAFFLAWGLMTGSAGADDFMQYIGQGSVNWTKGTIQGKGIGAPPEKYYGKPNARPMAIRAAKVVALRNILEAVNGIRVDSETVVRDFAIDSDVITTQVQGIVRGARQVNVEYMSDGTVEVIMEISMYGEFNSVLLPPTISGTPAPPMILTPDTSASPGTAPASTVYTGLVIDAKGLGVRPAMAPKVLDESGQEVYGSAFVSREYAVQQGMTGYAKNVDGARGNDRVTDNPLVVKALRVEGPGKCDVVISDMDAAMLRGAADTQSFLEKCRVMIVVD